MLTDQTQPTTTGAESRVERATPAEAVLLAQLAERLTSLETKVTSAILLNRSPVFNMFELVKLVFTGWPAFGLVIVLLFYSPIREALHAIPEKVRSADEIGLVGISLKATVKSEAAKSGVAALGDLLPRLSAGAVELLIQSNKSESIGLTVWTNNKRGNVSMIWLPSDELLGRIGELEAAGFALTETTVRQGNLKTGLAAAKLALHDLKAKYPGTLRNDSTVPDRDVWLVNESTSSPRDENAHIYWRVSPLGKQASEVVVRAVATSLASQHAVGGQKR